MAKFTSKPTEVEAVQFDKGLHPIVQLDAVGYFVNGKQGRVAVNVGDWIITEPDGSGHYPCADAIFRAKYSPAPANHVERMVLEGTDLSGKLSRLSDFLQGPFYHDLEEDEQNLLAAQASAMATYLRILTMRIKRAVTVE